MTREGREFLASEDTLSSKSKVWQIIDRSGGGGITSKEAEELTGLHHGKVSAALSALHEEGRVARLHLKRDGHSVYVHRDAVGGRPTVPRQYQSPWKTPPEVDDPPEPPRDRIAEILARRTGSVRQTSIPLSGPKVTLTRHQLHEAVYHAVTINRPASMTKTTAQQMAGRVAETALGLIQTGDDDGE